MVQKAKGPTKPARSSSARTPSPTSPAATRPRPEPDSSYKVVILHGGHGLGFSQIMPAFGDILTDQQIDDVIAYVRSFCHNTGHYPAGELNLPRALITEKAFPEDELVISTAADAGSPASWTTDVIHEQAFAGRNQIEIDVPINYANHRTIRAPPEITTGPPASATSPSASSASSTLTSAPAPSSAHKSASFSPPATATAASAQAPPPSNPSSLTTSSSANATFSSSSWAATLLSTPTNLRVVSSSAPPPAVPWRPTMASAASSLPWSSS